MSEKKMKEKIGTCLVYLVAMLIVGLGIIIGFFESDILFLVIGILLLLLLSIILLIKVKKDKFKGIENVDKGKKLAETVEKPWKSKQVVGGLFVYGFCVMTVTIEGIIKAIQGNTKFFFGILPIIGTFPAVITAFLSPKKCYIYEKGIQLPLRFVRWNEIIDCKLENGLLKIKVKGMREVILEDEKGDIWKIVGKMVKK